MTPRRIVVSIGRGRAAVWSTVDEGFGIAAGQRQTHSLATRLRRSTMTAIFDRSGGAALVADLGHPAISRYEFAKIYADVQVVSGDANPTTLTIMQARPLNRRSPLDGT